MKSLSLQGSFGALKASHQTHHTEGNYNAAPNHSTVISVAQTQPSNFTLKMLFTVALNNTFASLTLQRTLDLLT